MTVKMCPLDGAFCWEASGDIRDLTVCMNSAGFSWPLAFAAAMFCSSKSSSDWSISLLPVWRQPPS